VLHRSCSAVLFVSLLAWLALGSFAWAHDPGLSYVELRLQAIGLAGHVTLARADVEKLIPLDADADTKITDAELQRRLPELTGFAAAALDLESGGIRVAPSVGRIWLDSSDAVHFSLEWDRLSNSPLHVRSLVPAALPFGHRQFFSLQDAAGRKIQERILDARESEFDVDLDVVAQSRLLSAWEFIVLGAEHILTGYDHLLFLVGLLIVGGSFMEAAKIITAFTLAHSITLGIAAFDLVTLPPRVVEPLIALTVVYVGIENILGGDFKRRWALTFAFGLIHGFGFSSVLRELGVGADGSGIALPLFSFNLGVELGQAAVAAPILPIIWRLRMRPAFVSRWVPACSLAVTLAGVSWFVQRVAGG
jgi:hydrogenase/urease accessory protein HupE